MKASEKEFLKRFDSLCHGHTRGRVFHDWVTMASSALIVRANPNEAERSEAEYMALVDRYKPDELQGFAELLGIATVALLDEPQDFLGSVFMQAELGNDRMGQFFTPYHLSYLIADLTIHDIDVTKPLITVQEPACGSGGMIVALAHAAQKRGVDVQSQLYVVATDLSEVAARMCYIQFAVSGIPAHVCWGNTLSLEVYRTWATMAYWPIAHKVARWKRGDAAPVVQSMPEPQPAPTPISGPLVQAELFSL